MDLHYTLLHAVTEYDRKQSTRPGYNRYALAHYLGAINERIEPAIAAGSTVRAALVSNLSGRLLDVCLKSVGEPVSTREEQRGGGWLNRQA
jgi:hypothetical protein